ncbi:MAG: hypothetical protein KGL39_48970 [Patescibacteria group bacterium]|nr:hypothetical protein [Patescibacteria group bacterium]
MITPQRFAVVPIAHIDTIYNVSMNVYDLSIILRALQHAERNPSDSPRIDEMIGTISHSIYCSHHEALRKEHPASECNTCHPVPPSASTSQEEGLGE